LVVIISAKSQTPTRVCNTDRAALENMWVIGDVILMLSRPATQSKNPNIPVKNDPQMKGFASQEPESINPNKAEGSPFSRMNGEIMIADPRLVQ